MDSINTNQIVFWGPLRSGKTWLFNAFLKKIEILNNKLSKDYSLVAQQRIEGQWRDVDQVENFKVEPTRDLKQYQYRLLRKKLGRGPSAEVNTHCNEILVVDNTGGAFDGSNLNEAVVEQAKELVRSAKYLVLSLNSGLDENTTSGAIVENLLDLSNIINRGESGKYIAACLTKVDTLGEELVVEFYNRSRNELKSLLIRSFGAKYVDKIDDVLKEIERKGTNHVKLFATSATGYYYLNERKVQNIASDMGTLADPSLWKPEEVEKPFFWLFDVMERERLKYLSSNWSIFQTLMGRNTITESRQAAYIPYEMLVRIAQAQT